MADIPLTNITGFGSLPRLAPDSSFVSSRGVTQTGETVVSSIDVSGGALQTVLSLTGKYILIGLSIADITNTESVKSKLTIDGVVIFPESTYNSSASDVFFGLSRSTDTISEGYLVNSSLLFEYATTSDTDITLKYLIRPIL